MAEQNEKQAGKVQIQGMKDDAAIQAAAQSGSSASWQQKEAYKAAKASLAAEYKHNSSKITENQKTINKMRADGGEFYANDIADLQKQNASLEASNGRIQFNWANIDPSAPGEAQYQSVYEQATSTAPAIPTDASGVIEVGGNTEGRDRVNDWYTRKAGKKPVAKAETASVVAGNQARQKQREEATAPPDKPKDSITGIKPGDTIKEVAGEAVDSAVEYMKTSMANFKKQNKVNRDKKEEQEKVVDAMVGANATSLGYRSKGKLIAKIHKDTGIPLQKVQVFVNNKIKKMRESDDDPFKGVGGVN
jgi:hypothetical protein